MLLDPCPPKTRADLEWDRLLRALAARSVSNMGKALALDLPFASTRDETRRVLGESREATELLSEGEPIPITELGDVRAFVGRVGASGVLAPTEIREIGKTLTCARTLRRFLAARRARVPALFDACATDASLDALADELAQAFDPDGSLSDRASPRLKELRGEYQTARTRMLSRLDDLMQKYEAILQDRYVTEREGRYVVPVRSDAHERFPGIVHSTSSSGATLFVEPRAVIPMGNRLKVLEAEVQREEVAIYTRLSNEIGDALSSVVAAIDAIARADVRAATARLAQELDLVFPEVTDDARLNLVAARHPLLLLDASNGVGTHLGGWAEADRSQNASGSAAERQAAPHEAGRGVSPELARGDDPFELVVPSDLSISARRAMVVSGPNAGGKTVALKTMGLTALMIRAGLPVACGEGSVVGIFELVLTDVGDDQSLSKSLSTFSAHVRNLARILDDTQPGALVLLDELAGGTDPREGEALAAGMLDSLTARGGAVVVTTHYEGLKALALADSRFENASMGFDLASMSPTFRLAQGVPGSSSALAVARKFGLPETVIERAQKFLTREDIQFESAVQKLNDERAALDLARSAAARTEAEARLLTQKLDEELRAAQDREQRHLSKEAESLLGLIRRTREELREVQARLRSKKLDAAAAKEADKLVDRASARLAIGGELEPLILRSSGGAPTALEDPPKGPVADATTLKKGARVWVSRLRAEAEVVDVLPDGSARVQAGAMKIVLPASELRLTSDKRIEADAKSKTARDEPDAKKRAARGDSLEGMARGPAGRDPTARDRPLPSRDPAGLETAVQTSENTVDLRGLRTDDAVSLAVTFLDRSINENRAVCFIVHGHGSGAVREAIRRELKSSPYVRFFRAGNQNEGGDGVTIAWLS